MTAPVADNLPAADGPADPLLESSEGMSVTARTQWQLISRRFFRHRYTLSLRHLWPHLYREV